MKVEHVVPILNVTDVEASVAWFGKLGWAPGFQWRGTEGGPVDFGAVVAGDLEIFLCRDGQGGRGRGTNTATFGPDGDQQADKGAWVSIWVDDVDTLHERALAAGLEVTHPPTDEPWNVREFHVRHPDGHVFRVSRSTI
jgi:catechol 2,3-dioxygenase-like lactoylglutathione lyase family enzyme